MHLLSWAAPVCPDAHTPEHPGEIVSPRILRHAPSCYILVTQRAPDWRVRGAFFEDCFELGQLSVSELFSPQPPVTPAVGRSDSIDGNPHDLKIESEMHHGKILRGVDSLLRQ